MNERELRILRALVDSLRAIQQDVHGINEQQRANSNEEQPPSEVNINSEIRLPPPINNYYESENAEGPKDRRRDRIRLALECLALGAAILAGIFTFRTLGQVQRQANAAEKQVGIMREQLETADRPWLAVDVSIASPLTYTPQDGVRITLNIVTKNVGKSPAQNISMEPKLVSAGMGTDVRAKQNELCENIAKGETGFPGSIVFPGFDNGQQFGIGLSKDDIDVFWGKDRLARFGNVIDPIPIAVIGCVDYTFASSGENPPAHHHTAFVYDVLMKDKGLVLKSKTPLAPGSLILMQHAEGGYSAN